MTEHTGKALGQQLGNYRLQSLLGTGGFADVYLGEHLHLGTLAAIKVLHTKLTGEDAKFFVQEARLIARLSHPHIIRVFDFDVEDMTPFLVMDYAPGGTLRQRHPKGTQVPLDSIIGYVKQIADGLQSAHEQRLVHRDIKPENMLIDQHGAIVLSDFGVASVAHSTESQTIVELAGTLPYIAPEQLQGLPRPASDQYALAVVVYEWISGTRPFQGTFAEIVSQHLVKAPPPLCGRVPGITQAIESVIFKAMSKEPHARFETIQEFAYALERAYQGESTLKLLTGDAGMISEIVNHATQEMQTEHIGTSATPFYAVDSPYASAPHSSNTPPSYPSTFNLPQQVTPPPTYSELPRAPLASQSHAKRSWKLVAVIVSLLLIVLSGAALLAFHKASQGAVLGGTAATSVATGATSHTPTTAPATAKPTVNSQATVAAQQAVTQTAVAQAQATATAQQAAVATQTAVVQITATAQASTPQGLYNAVTSRQPTFRDSLSAQSARNWATNTACTFSGGKYVISAPAGTFAPCTAANTHLCNMGYQVQMTTLSGDGGGLIFRNASNGYRFRVGPDGSYDLAGTIASNPSGSSAAIHKGINATNQLTAIAQGSKISLYVNARYITSVTDSASNCGNIGLMAVGFGSVGSAAFSNATVWTL
jgi:eukaryotic-like serine/threonine-protein kinase